MQESGKDQNRSGDDVSWMARDAVLRLLLSKDVELAMIATKGRERAYCN
jgi:hypothetical protein